MMKVLDRLVSWPPGVFALLALGASLEAYGDSCFQQGFYRSSGSARVLALLAGVAVLGAYGSIVNVPRWDFGRLIGVYVVMFFLVAQVLNRVRFGHGPTPQILVGGALIVAGGAVIALAKN